jgi:hypothetical protein
MQKSGFFMIIIFAELLFKVSAWLSNHAVCKIGLTFYFLLLYIKCSKILLKVPTFMPLKVNKNEQFLFLLSSVY